ncbi:MAG: hypothetical protein ACOYXT_30135 [Bacteroidota bacterium]
MKLFNSILSVLRFNRKNWKAVVLCIFAATVFWFFNALNKTYTTNISFPLSFDYDERHYVPVRTPTREVRINVTGNGWDLFRRSTGIKVPPLEIPLERPGEVKKIVGTTLPAFFSSQLDGFQINFIVTDTVYIDLEPKAGRWISLSLDSANRNLKRGYGLASKVEVSPDSIFIEGPQRIITQIKEPVKLKLKKRNIDENFREDVEIDLPHGEVIKRDPPTVSVAFSVGMMMAVQDSVSLRLINIPPGVWPTRDKRKIAITVAMPENLKNQFTLDSAIAVISLRGVKRGQSKLLPVIIGLPQFCKVVKIDSVHVKL